MKYIFAVVMVGLAGCASKSSQESFDEKYRGSMDNEGVRKVMRANTDKFIKCYTEGLKTQPEGSGRVLVRFEINDQGKVVKSEAAESSLKNKATGDCVAQVVKAQKFPVAPEGVLATVDFPLFFDKAPESK